MVSSTWDLLWAPRETRLLTISAQKYLIQPDKPMAWDKRWTSYIRRHGWASWKGAVKVLIPAWSMNYAVMYYGVS